MCPEMPLIAKQKFLTHFTTADKLRQHQDCEFIRVLTPLFQSYVLTMFIPFRNTVFYQSNHSFKIRLQFHILLTTNILNNKRPVWVASMQEYNLVLVLNSSETAITLPHKLLTIRYYETRNLNALLLTGHERPERNRKRFQVVYIFQVFQPFSCLSSLHKIRYLATNHVRVCLYGNRIMLIIVKGTSAVSYKANVGRMILQPMLYFK